MGRTAVRRHGATRAEPATAVRRGLGAILAGVMALAAVFAAAPHGVPSARAQSVDDYFRRFQDAAERHDERIVVVGTRTRKPDAHDDQDGPKNPLADVRESEVFDVEELRDWLLVDPFGCDAEGTACSPRGRAEPEAFASGGWLFVIEVGAPIATLPANMRLEVGVLVKLAQYPGADAPGDAINGSSHINVFRQQDDALSVLEFGVGTGTFEEYQTRTRVNISENIVALFVPKQKDWPTAPEAWTPYAFVSDGTQAGTSRDVGVKMGDPPPAIGTPPTLTFEAASAATTAPATGAPATAGAATPPVATASAAPTPGASAAGTPTVSSGGLDPLLIVIVALGLILLVLGFWLLRGRRRAPPPAPPPPEQPKPPLGPGGPVVGDPGKPTPPPIPPPPPPPPPRNCVEGDEEWRNDKPAATFLIAPADARVRITNEPTTPGLEGWMAPFGFPHGSTAAAFGAVEDALLDTLLAGLPEGPTTYHWLIEFELDEYRLECERRWICQDDVWVSTDATRLRETGPSLYAGRLAVDGPARTRDDVREMWLRVRAAMVGAGAAEAAMDTYRKAC